MEVENILSGLGVEFDREFIDARTGYSIDITIGNIAIEVNGPSHYIQDIHDMTRWCDGSTLFKKKILERMGWKVGWIDYSDWYNIPNKEDFIISLMSSLIDH